MLWLTLILIIPYLILLFEIYRGLLRIRSFKSNGIPSTYVSVVISCRNEEINLPVVLGHLAHQNYPPELYEVIIVNDNSSDDTHQTASCFKGINNITVLDNAGTGKKIALRSGINAAQGPLIITTDADCSFGENWIRTIALFYESSKSDMIVCPVRIEPSKGFTGRFQELEFLSLQGITAGSVLIGNAVMCNGANLAFRKEVYTNHSHNLHDEIKSGDDVFFLHSLKANKHSKIRWLESEESMVKTRPVSSLRSYLKQRNRWIAKSRAYSDKFTVILGISTFSAIILQVVFFTGLMFNQSFILPFIILFSLKSIPDFLILFNTSSRYNEKILMRWFIPSQLIYPFYVTGVVLYGLIDTFRQVISSPSQKGT